MERLNVISTGTLPAGSVPDIFAAAVPDKQGPFSGVRLFNALIGGAGPVIMGNNDKLAATDFKTGALNGAGSGGLTIVVDGTGLGAHYRITTPAVADDGHYANWSNDGGTTGFGAWAIPKSDEYKPIHAGMWFKFSSLLATFMFGLVLPAETTHLDGTSELSAGGAAQFCGVFHDGDSSATGIAAVIKNASGDTFTFASQDLEDASGTAKVFAINTWYQIGFRVLDKRAAVEFYVRALGEAWPLKPAMVLTTLTDLPDDDQELTWGVAATSSDGTAVTFDFLPPVLIQERGVYLT